MNDDQVRNAGAGIGAAGRLPRAVYLLGYCLFAMGSTEFLVAGVLPDVAADLQIPIAPVGWIITAFAVGVVVGGPPLALLTRSWPARGTLIATQLVFAAAVAAGAASDSFAVLLLTRFLCGLAYAGFFAVAAVTAVRISAPNQAARASSVVVGGLTVAMVAGGPAGTFLSQYLGWRGSLWIIVLLTVLGAFGCLAIRAPGVRESAGALSGAAEIRSLLTRPLLLVFAITIFSTAAYMITYNYLSALLRDVTQMDIAWIPAQLALFGIAAFLGITIGGRYADAHPHRTLAVGAAGIAITSTLLAVVASHAAAVVPLVPLLGFAGFLLNPAIYGRVFSLATAAPTIAGATTVSAFQLGISATPLFAALALNQCADLTVVCWLGAALAVITMVLVTSARHSNRRRKPVVDAYAPDAW